MCSVGIQSSGNPFLTGSVYNDIVDMAYYQLTNPLPKMCDALDGKGFLHRPFAPFVLQPLGPLHIVKSTDFILHEIAEMERASWVDVKGVSSWPPNTLALATKAKEHAQSIPEKVSLRWECIPQANVGTNGVMIE